MNLKYGYGSCPACSCKRRKKFTGCSATCLYTCAKCDAVYGECYLGESYEVVKPWFSAENVPTERVRYFDFLTLGSQGIARRHGWYDRETGLIVQTG
jgi:hypothetical protein